MRGTSVPQAAFQRLRSLVRGAATVHPACPLGCPALPASTAFPGHRHAAIAQVSLKLPCAVHIAASTHTVPAKLAHIHHPIPASVPSQNVTAYYALCPPTLHPAAHPLWQLVYSAPPAVCLPPCAAARAPRATPVPPGQRRPPPTCVPLGRTPWRAHRLAHLVRQARMAPRQAWVRPPAVVPVTLAPLGLPRG